MSDSKKDKRGGHDINPKGRLSCGCCDTLQPGNESQNRTRRERESMRLETAANETTKEDS